LEKYYLYDTQSCFIADIETNNQLKDSEETDKTSNYNPKKLDSITNDPLEIRTNENFTLNNSEYTPDEISKCA